jgi:hypothetical protein
MQPGPGISDFEMNDMSTDAIGSIDGTCDAGVDTNIQAYEPTNSDTTAAAPVNIDDHIEQANEGSLHAERSMVDEMQIDSHLDGGCIDERLVAGIEDLLDINMLLNL